MLKDKKNVALSINWKPTVLGETTATPIYLACHFNWNYKHWNLKPLWFKVLAVYCSEAWVFPLNADISSKSFKLSSRSHSCFPVLKIKLCHVTEPDFRAAWVYPGAAPILSVHFICYYPFPKTRITHWFIQYSNHIVSIINIKGRNKSRNKYSLFFGKWIVAEYQKVWAKRKGRKEACELNSSGLG